MRIPRATRWTVVAFLLCAALVVGMNDRTTANEAAAAGDRKTTSTTCLVYVGTYTGGSSKGIHLLSLDMKSGACTRIGLAAEVANASFLAIHPDKAHLYAVNESDPGSEWRGGAVTAFAIVPDTGMLKRINQQSSGGGGPCHLAIDPSGRCVVTANYGSGSAAALPILPDGSLGPPASTMQHKGSSVNPRRQAGPHAHSATISPDGSLALIADLGLDKVMVYRLDAAHATLTPNDPPAVLVKPGDGPRHMAFHPNGRYVYLLNEMGSSVAAYDWAADTGTMHVLQTISTLPAGADVPDNTGAEVQVHPNGRFLYASNRVHDSIAIFAIDPATGKLTAIGHQLSGGKIPRGFTVDPTGTFLVAANQKSDNVVVFRIDSATGTLKKTSEVAGIGSPVCVKFLLRQ